MLTVDGLGTAKNMAGLEKNVVDSVVPTSYRRVIQVDFGEIASILD